MNRPTVLSIAGFDPSGGAGLLADIKTFESIKTYGLSVITALTWQNESEFEKVEWLSPEKINAQIELLLKKSKVEYAKIGLIENADALHGVVGFLHSTSPGIKIIWDPILKASAGFDFHTTSSLESWQKTLDKVFLITPNWLEAAWLANGAEGLQAGELLAVDTNVFLKGGHNLQKVGYDYLFTKKEDNSKCYPYRPKAKIVWAKHGSGCVLSASVTAYLAKGYPLQKACLAAKQYVSKFLTSNPTLLGYHKL